MENILYEINGIVNLFHSLLPALTMVILSVQFDVPIILPMNMSDTKNRNISKIAICLIIHCQQTKHC
jgi:hypothetical protein